MLPDRLSPLVADRVEDPDRQAKVRVRATPGRAASIHGRARVVPASDGGLVEERLVCSDELPARRGGVGARGRRQPAEELVDGRLDPAVEQQAAVAGQRTPDPIGEVADDAEVDVADDVVREDEEVGRVEVGMERPEHVDLVEHVPVEVTDDPVAIVSLRLESVEVRLVAVPDGDDDVDERDALDELGREHARCRVGAMDACDPLDPSTPCVVVQDDRLARLDQVVELIRGPARELVDDRATPRRSEEPQPVEDERERVHEVDVGLERLADAGALDLDRDALAGVEGRSMDLSDRGRRERGRFEGRVDHLGRRAELAAPRSREPRRIRRARRG